MSNWILGGASLYDVVLFNWCFGFVTGLFVAWLLYKFLPRSLPTTGTPAALPFHPTPAAPSTAVRAIRFAETATPGIDNIVFGDAIVGYIDREKRQATFDSIEAQIAAHQLVGELKALGYSVSYVPNARTPGRSTALVE